MYKTVKILTVFSLAVVSSFAQPQGEGFGGVMTGFTYFDVEELNSRTSRLGFTEFNSIQYIVGGRGYGLIEGRLLIGGSGFGIIPQSVESDSVRATLTGGTGFFEAGYALITFQNYSLIPIVGIGGGAIALKAEPMLLAQPQFDSVLTDPRRSATISASGFAVKLGIINHFAWDVAREQRHGRVNVFKMGGNIETSLIYMPRREWRLDHDTALFNAPEMSNYMILMSATILFGGREEREEQ